MWVSLFSPISMAVGRAEAVVAAWSGSAAGASAELRGCTRVSQVELASPLSLLSLSVDSSGDGDRRVRSTVCHWLAQHEQVARTTLASCQPFTNATNGNCQLQHSMLLCARQ